MRLKSRDRAQPGARQFLPGRGEQVSGQAEQGVERRMAVRLLAGEGPEIGQDLGIEEQLRTGVDLIGARRLRTDLLNQLEARGLPAGGEAGRVAQSPEPLRSRASRPSV